MKLHQNLIRGVMCAGLAVTLSFAQAEKTTTTTTDKSTVNKTTPEKHEHQSSSTTSTSTSTTASDANQSMVGKQDQEFMMHAARGGMMEVQAAQMAQQKASSQEVKDFARKIEQDHSQANEKLKKIAQERQVSLPSDIGTEHQAQMTKLNAMSGGDFDKAYMKMMVNDHRKDVKQFERESNRSMDTDIKEFAQATLPTLRDHLTQAEQLNNSTRSRSADTSSSSAASSDTNAKHKKSKKGSADVNESTGAPTDKSNTTGTSGKTTPPQP